MRFVFFADLHLDTAFAWAGPEVARKRRQSLRDSLRAILSLADEVDADAILCAGDLYEHERFTPDTRAFLRSTFVDTHRRIFIAPGNHDYYGPTSLYAQVAWPPNVTIFRTAHFTAVELTQGLTLWGAAFQGPTRTSGFLDHGFHVDRGGTHLALFHGSERSGLVAELAGKVPHAPFDAPQIREAGLSHAFVGHYHEPRDAESHTYPGNPDPLSFGETGKRGAVIVDISPDGSVCRDRRVLATSEVHDIETDITGCTNFQEIRDRAAATLSGLTGVARLTLTGELSPDVDLDLESLRHLVHELDAPPVVRTRNLAVGYYLNDIAKEPTVRGQFVRDVLAAALDEDEGRRILFTGLRALEGRDDLELP